VHVVGRPHEPQGPMLVAVRRRHPAQQLEELRDAESERNPRDPLEPLAVAGGRVGEIPVVEGDEAYVAVDDRRPVGAPVSA
jgi:hypothetical protein